ncbi:MAG: efflux RND transporter periplasmic adaptor subunit [Desulfobacterales bacterium]
MARHLSRWLLILLLVVALGFWMWRVTRPDPLEVAVKAANRGTVERTVANTRAGTVKACRRAKLSPSVGGQIAVLPIKEGDAVKKGQLLLELWNDDLTARTVLAEREVESARSRARSACFRAEVSQRNADRLVMLRKDDVVPEERADNAVAEAAALQAECNAARTEINVREAQWTVARAKLEQTRLVAPFDGVIAEINGELFEFVTPSPLGVATPPVVDIIDNACFYVSAPIDEVDAADIRVGMPARISLDAFRNERFDGSVRRIADYVLDIEKQARTVDVEAVFDELPAGAVLLAGYSADIEVILEVRHDVVRVPTEAVMDGQRVFVFSPDPGSVSIRHIRIGLANWDWTEVIEGLSPDELVVVNVDNPDLRDGAAARRVEEES